jgi:type II secretory pathway component PulC
MRSSLFVAFALFACGGASEPPAAPVSQAPPAPPSAPAKQPRAEGTLPRTEVNAVIDRGFGRFLATLEVEPSLEDGRFRGWTIVELAPVDLWSEVDLRAGDVVLSVNGMPIERDTEAFDAFQSLRHADALTVAYARDGAERRLSYQIVP